MRPSTLRPAPVEAESLYTQAEKAYQGGQVVLWEFESGYSKGVFNAAGLKLNVFNPAPWLYTLPVPVVVLAVSTLTIGRMLSRLDPVAIIERR